MGIAVFMAVEAVARQTTMPSPTYMVRMDHHQTQHVIDYAETLGVPEGPRITLYQIPADKANFRKHFENIAAQRGWVISEERGILTEVLIPTQDIPQFTAIKASPIGWIIQHNQPGQKAATPTTNDITRVTIKRDTGGARHFLTIFAVSAMGLLSVLALAKGISQFTGPDPDDGVS